MTANKDHILWKTDKLWFSQGNSEPVSLSRDGELNGRPTFHAAGESRLLFTGFWTFVKVAKINWMSPNITMHELDEEFAMLGTDMKWVVTVKDTSGVLIRIFSNEAKDQVQNAIKEQSGREARKAKEVAEIKLCNISDKLAGSLEEEWRSQVVIEHKPREKEDEKIQNGKAKTVFVDEVDHLEQMSFDSIEQSIGRKEPQDSLLSRTINPFNETLRNWTVEKVADWVTSLAQSYELYGKVFTDEGIDGVSLAEGDWEPNDLVDIGVKPVHARRILRKIRQFSESDDQIHKINFSSPRGLDFVSPRSDLVSPTSSMGRSDQLPNPGISMPLLMMSRSLKMFESQNSNIGESKEEKDIYKDLFSPFFADKLKELAVFHEGVGRGVEIMEKQVSYIEKLKTAPQDHHKNHDGFLSHVQRRHGDFCRSVAFALKEKEVSCWYDKNAKRLDMRGMIEGVAKSNEFVMFIVREYFDRPYCVFEYLVAQAFGKSVTIVLEGDHEKGGLEVKDLGKVVPKLFLQKIDLENGVISLNRAYFDDMVLRIAKRIVRHRTPKSNFEKLANVAVDGRKAY